MAKAPVNKYRQQPVERVDKEPEKKVVSEHTTLKVGDLVLCSRNALFFTVNNPCTILSIKATKACVSGWLVEVETSTGPRSLDSGYFTKAEHQKP